MARRTAREGSTTVAHLNGWAIVRDRQGAATYWSARVLCPEGYLVARQDTGTRREAEAHARSTTPPAPREPTPEILAARAANAAAMAHLNRA